MKTKIKDLNRGDVFRHGHSAYQLFSFYIEGYHLRFVLNLTCGNVYDLCDKYGYFAKGENTLVTKLKKIKVSELT